MNQVRPVKEFGLGLRKGEIQKAYEKGGLGSAAARTLLGGRVQTGLQEEKRITTFWFQLKDSEATIRKGIRIAEKSGDDDRVVKLKLKLLGEYKKFVDIGGDPEDIPKWARDDMQQFRSPAE